MLLDKIIRLGNPELYEVSSPVDLNKLNELGPTIELMHDALFEFKAKYGAGRAISAPQLGIKLRLIYAWLNDKPWVLINPKWLDFSNEMIELWDDCMSFPELYVRVRRYKQGTIQWTDLNGELRECQVSDADCELFQHEIDHLDGILATQRAMNNQAFMLRDEFFKNKFITNSTC